MMRRVLAFLTALLLAMTSLPVAAADHARNWYEIFVYSYQDSNGDGVGDLPGLLSRLDYIEDMGFNGIWLMPVMPSPSYHKYDVTDYMAVDAAYGTVDDLRTLTDACHDRDIEVIIDLPVNHTSTQHPWFQAACAAIREGRTEDPYAAYYHFTQQPGSGYVQLEGTDWYYEEQFVGGGMPDLDLDSEAVRAELTAILAFWLNEVGVDGFRLDAVTSYYTGDPQRNIGFLSWLKVQCESLKPGSYLVGECWAGLDTIASYYDSGVDSFFLFPASQAEGWIAADVRARNGAPNYTKHVQRMHDAIPGLAAPFIGNHDTGRAVGAIQARSNLARAKFAEGLLNMMGGAAFTYYGEEIGMIGAATDPDKRLPMYWNDGDMTTPPPGATRVEYAYPCVDDQLADPASLLHYVRQVNAARLAVPAIARGQNENLDSDDRVCLMRRSWENESCYIAINFSASEHRTAVIPAAVNVAADLETGEEQAAVRKAGGETLVNLPPLSVVVLQ